MTDLLILADRVEGLSGQSRAIEREIAQAVLGDEVDPISATPHAFCPAYTASLDAAMQLVPEGVFLRLDCTQPQAIIVRWDKAWIEVARSLCAMTPAIAITAACLRTIAANQENPL